MFLPEGTRGQEGIRKKTLAENEETENWGEASPSGGVAGQRTEYASVRAVALSRDNKAGRTFDSHTNDLWGLLGSRFLYDFLQGPRAALSRQSHIEGPPVYIRIFKGFASAAGSFASWRLQSCKPAKL